MPIHLIEVHLAALEHMAGAIPHLPWWARCLGWVVGCWPC